jgi:ABC-2 type transport system ATP-binding protein
MTDRPHTFTLRSSNDRGLASALLDEPAVSGVTLDDGMLVVRAADFGTFSRAVSGQARGAGISLYELLPTDESLESVFSYLVRG